MNSKHIGLKLYGAFVALILVLPTLIVIPVSFSNKSSFVFPDGWSLRWYETFFTDRGWMAASWNSVQIGLLSALLATVAGTAAAIGLTRWSRRKTSSTLSSILLSPMVVPGIVMAIGIYMLFSQIGLLGTVHGFVIAHAMLGIPFVVVAVTASLSGLDVQLEKAAASMGATPFGVFRQITLPLIVPGVASGALFAFVSSFDEVIVSLFIKSPFLETLPVRMYSSVTDDSNPTIAAAGTLVLLFTTLILAVGSAFSRSRRRKLSPRSSK